MGEIVGIKFRRGGSALSIRRKKRKRETGGKGTPRPVYYKFLSPRNFPFAIPEKVSWDTVRSVTIFCVARNTESAKDCRKKSREGRKVKEEKKICRRKYATCVVRKFDFRNTDR